MKQTKSSKKSETGIYVPIARPSSQSCSISQATLDHMRDCEAREWITRFNRKIGEQGLEIAQSWWAGVKVDIERRRGKLALDDLVRRMNLEKKNGGKRT
jgi:hypothetical protein